MPKEVIAGVMFAHYEGMGVLRGLMESGRGRISPLSARNDELRLLSSGLYGAGETSRESSTPCLRVSKIVCISALLQLILFGTRGVNPLAIHTYRAIHRQGREPT